MGYRPFALIACAVLPSAFAWNWGGHLASAEIAYQELMPTNLAVVERIEKIMHAFPTSDEFDQAHPMEVSTAKKSERLFLEMAALPYKPRLPRVNRSLPTRSGTTRRFSRRDAYKPHFR